VRVTLCQAGPNLELRVIDNGKGIAPALLPCVFDRFRQGDSSTTRAHGGLGIGLTIARHIVELHGGWISADSEGEGRGATFTVVLPAATPAQMSAGAAEAPVAEAPPGTPDLAGISVLLVDDDRDTREMIAQMLMRFGLQVTAVASAREALTSLVRKAPNLLISDIAMPEQDGHELIRIIRELPASRGGEVPAIALTAYARDEDRRRALAAGFQLHLPKPVDPARLAEAIAQLALPATPTEAQHA
jgi:CheY-like chemotaxis protein